MITQEELKRILCYDAKTGIFTWLVNTGGMFIGSVAGHITTRGYIRIGIHNKEYMAHRLAWLYMEGYFPEEELDHKNGNTTDNSWSNLRPVRRRCNLQNTKIWSHNTSKFTGVYWDKRNTKWAVEITVDGQKIFLGRYDCKLNAALARYTFETWCSKWTCDLRNENRKNVESALRYYIETGEVL